MAPEASHSLKKLRGGRKLVEDRAGCVFFPPELGSTESTPLGNRFFAGPSCIHSDNHRKVAKTHWKDSDYLSNVLILKDKSWLKN